jgi:hypothetical protein
MTKSFRKNVKYNPERNISVYLPTAQGAVNDRRKTSDANEKKVFFGLRSRQAKMKSIVIVERRYPRYIPLRECSFASVGTNVNTLILTLTQPK